MKRILIFFFLALFVTVAQAQTYKYLTVPGETGYSRGALRVDGILWIGYDTLPIPVSLRMRPAIAAKGDSLYRWSVPQGKWLPIGSGGAGVWGSMSGTLANQLDLQAALNNKQNKIIQGTAAQYFKGDLSLGNFNTDVTAIVSGQYSPLSHTHNGLLPIGGATGYVLRKNSNTDFDATWQPIDLVSPVSSVFGRTGAVTAQAGDYSAFFPATQRVLDSLSNHWAAIMARTYTAAAPLYLVGNQFRADTSLLSTRPWLYKALDSALQNFTVVADMDSAIVRLESINDSTIRFYAKGGWYYDLTRPCETTGGTVINAPTLTSTAGATTITFGTGIHEHTQVFTGTEATWVLPVVAGNSARVLHIINKGTDELTLTGTIWNGIATATVFVLPGDVATFQNDGTHWLKRN